MKHLLHIIVLVALSLGIPAQAETGELIIVQGADGTDDYGKRFATAADTWQTAGEKSGRKITMIGRGDAADSDLSALQTALSANADSPAPLWLVLIGHGTFDGRNAMFNLRGKDVSAADLKEWTAEHKRPMVIIHTGAASAPFIKVLSAKNRIIVTATKSASEDSYARFGEFLATTISSPLADIDKDGGTSLLEAFIAAAKEVEDFYQKEGRIATEQALIDDNGDSLGTPAKWFRGTRAVKTAKDGAKPDGLRSHQAHLISNPADADLSPEILAERDALEAELFALREKKKAMPAEQYFAQLEIIARKLARLYHPEEEAKTEPPE